MEHYIAKDVIEWFENFADKDYRIVSENKDFMIHLDNDSLSHLLGLHYMEMGKRVLPGKVVLRNIKHFNISDERILNAINNKHGYAVGNKVIKRIKTFKGFMENIDKATIVEKTHPSTNINSQYLVIETNEGTTKHLGIYQTGDKNVLLDYDVNVLETYIVQKNDNYYRGSAINESVKQLLVYDDSKNLWRAGSFNLEKDIVLQNITLSMQDEQYEELLDEVKEMESFEYKGFHFLGLRIFTPEENEYSLQEMSSFLAQDGMAGLENYSCDEFMKNDLESDLFFNLETRNVYMPGNHQLFRWEISEEEVAVCLENKLEEFQAVDVFKLEKSHKMSL